MFNVPGEFHHVGESLFTEFFDLSIIVNEVRNPRNVVYLDEILNVLINV